jgi:hypothetical protein
MEAVEVEIVEATEVVIVEDTEAGAAVAAIVVMIVAAQVAAVTKRVMARRATGLLTKAAIADRIRAGRQHAQIRIGEAAGILAANPGIKNRLESQGRRRGFSFVG